eukprot:scaffold37874_cov72-Phaeocystis_antarctica.AAC.3
MGQIVEVKVAYATNVIVAKGLGSVASKAMVEQIAKSEAEAIAASAEEKKKASATKATLQSKYAKAGIVFEVQVAKDGSIDAVGSEQVAAEISRSGTPVLAVNVEMDEITEVGESVIATVVLHKDVDMQVEAKVAHMHCQTSFVISPRGTGPGRSTPAYCAPGGATPRAAPPARPPAPGQLACSCSGRVRVTGHRAPRAGHAFNSHAGG